MSNDLAVVERNNDLAVAELISEKRDMLMRKHIDVADKMINEAEALIDCPEYHNSTREKKRKDLGSLARTVEVLTNIQARAAKFDHVAKPKDEGPTKVSLFVNMVPLNRAAVTPYIEAHAEEHP